MTSAQRSAAAGGIVLILLGIFFLAGQLIPSMWSWVNEFSWPLIVVGVGVLLLVIGALANAPGMAVPACIVGGIGLLLWWQNRTGNWETWAYAWTLIPGFVGVGTIVMGLWERKWSGIRGGLWLVLISVIMFAVLGSLFGGMFGGDLGFLAKWWPVGLILLGVLSLIDYVTKPRHVDAGRS
jgi:hypothetical protein